MFSKKNRLPIKESSRKNQKIISGSFVLQKQPNELKKNRFAVIISARIEPRSTRRHHLKRIISEEMRKWPNYSTDFLIVTSPNIQKATNETLRDELGSIQKKLNLGL